MEHPNATGAGLKRLDLSAIDADPAAVMTAMDRGMKYVTSPWVASLIVPVEGWTKVQKVTRDDNPIASGALLATLVFGWWSLPHGPLLTVRALRCILRGGEDVSDQVLSISTSPETDARKPGPPSTPARFVTASLAAMVIAPVALLTLWCSGPLTLEISSFSQSWLSFAVMGTISAVAIGIWSAGALILGGAIIGEFRRGGALSPPFLGRALLSLVTFAALVPAASAVITEVRIQLAKSAFHELGLGGLAALDANDVMNIAPPDGVVEGAGLLVEVGETYSLSRAHLLLPDGRDALKNPPAAWIGFVHRNRDSVATDDNDEYVIEVVDLTLGEFPSGEIIGQQELVDGPGEGGVTLSQYEVQNGDLVEALLVLLGEEDNDEAL